MKQKHTNSRKGNRGPSITASYPYNAPVFIRRVNDALDADHKEFSAKHPGLDDAVEGYKTRLRLQKIREKEAKKAQDQC